MLDDLDPPDVAEFGPLEVCVPWTQRVSKAGSNDRDRARWRGKRAALTGLIVNLLLVVIKLVAGIVGACLRLDRRRDRVVDRPVRSLVVWGGLHITTRPADEDYPYGYGKAETLATVVVSVMLLGAAFGIAVAAIGEIRTPHHLPAPFTLVVLAVVVVVKETLFRTVLKVSDETGSPAVKADAWHHRSDAITSAAAFVGHRDRSLGRPGVGVGR